MLFKKALLPFVLLCLLACACTPTRRLERFCGHRLEREIRNSTVFAKSFSGFTLLDPESGKTWCDVNGQHLFTPASTTKILTLYTCLHTLGDTLSRLRYEFGEGDTSEPEGAWAVAGIGDPTFLHPAFAAWQPQPSFFAQHPHAMQYLFNQPGFPQQTRWGKGWAWDDLSEAYSPEISALPLYGNCLKMNILNNKWEIYPKYFQDSVRLNPDLEEIRQNPFSRLLEAPLYPNHYTGSTPAYIPVFDPVNRLLPSMNDSLHLHLDNPDPTILFAKGRENQFWRVTPTDTVYRRMMYQSDNFIAEQLLLMCAEERFGYMLQDSMIRWAKDSLFAPLPQQFRWADGSGLSRYNLNSPQNLAEILRRLWKEQPQERLFSFFPIGGISGTLVDWYKGKAGKPYIFAKSGSMSGVQCLSGYVVTKQGKVLIFTFMHNNFTGSGKPWKLEMQRILEMIRDR
jgi:D-alanyl-D-alanine carboxypeptidase/D-alanyl-D-alanine-endopeptidase (penicillin-binding protein 4)